MQVDDVFHHHSVVAHKEPEKSDLSNEKISNVIHWATNQFLLIRLLFTISLIAAFICFLFTVKEYSNILSLLFKDSTMLGYI